MMKEKICDIIRHPFWGRRSTIIGLGLILVIVSVVLHIHDLNNFLIYKHVFLHAADHKNLFALYPEDHFDCNHYGPLFSLVIAPFAVIPWFKVAAGCFHAFLVAWFYFAIKSMEMERWKKIVMVWLLAQELLFDIMWSQFNAATVAMILLTFSCVRKERDGWAAFWIMLGTLIKIYGIVGLAFWLFSKHKMKFIGWCIVWALVLFALPMLFFGPEYILSQYSEWYTSLASKTQDNNFSPFQNISLLGMLRKIGYALTAGGAAYMQVFREESAPDVANWWVSSWSDLYAIIPGLLLFLLPLARIHQYKNYGFQLALLCSVLIFINLFSTGTEECSYISSMAAAVIWYYNPPRLGNALNPWKRSTSDLMLIVLAMVASFSVTDLCPGYLRTQWIRPYALKALPFVLIWFKLIWEMCTKDYKFKTI